MQEALQQQFVDPPVSVVPHAKMRVILETQRGALQRAGAPSLQERRADLAKLAAAVRHESERIADVIAADFGHRSRHETELAEIFPVLSAIRHARSHLRRWMRPKRVSVGIELRPARAAILHQPVGVVGIISPWNYPFHLAIMPLVAALAAGNRVVLKPSELAPRTAEFLAEFLGGLFPFEKVATVIGGADVGAAFARLPDQAAPTGRSADLLHAVATGGGPPRVHPVRVVLAGDLAEPHDVVDEITDHLGPLLRGQRHA